MKHFESGILSNLKFESRILPVWNVNPESAVRLKFESRILDPPLQGPIEKPYILNWKATFNSCCVTREGGWVNRDLKVRVDGVDLNKKQENFLTYNPAHELVQAPVTHGQVRQMWRHPSRNGNDWQLSLEAAMLTRDSKFWEWAGVRHLRNAYTTVSYYRSLR